MDAEAAGAPKCPTMTNETPLDRRVGLAIAAASASVTIALGVTAGTFLGWVHPPRPAAVTRSAAATDVSPPLAPTAEAPQAIQAPVEAAPAPVRAQRRAAPRARRTMLADASDRRTRVRHDDDHHGREHHEDEDDD